MYSTDYLPHLFRFQYYQFLFPFIFSIQFIRLRHYFLFFFFNDTATTEIYTLSLHDALPICVAAPEAANNAGAQTSFIPLLTLGIPSNPVMALMMGAMLIQGIAPGTAIISDRPELFWGMVASMWVGNLMLIVINLPLIGIWVRLLRVPYRLLFPCIVGLCCVGAYSVNSSTFLILMMAGFALLGYVFSKLGCEGAPFLLGFVLGPLMEENFRRSMVLSFGDPM